VPIPLRVILGFVLLAAPGFAGTAWGDSAQTKQAILATVTGDDQQVGFRAAVMKQAITYNLAGVAKNDPNQVVHFTLQGDPTRIGEALAVIRTGTKRSSGVEVSTAPAAVDPVLNTFTIVDWTSSSRHITNPYTLVFTLRPDGSEVSKSQAKQVWHDILKSTLKGDDLSKLGDED
jgi:acylphosphatase